MDAKDACKRMSDVFKYVPSKEQYENFIRAIGKYSNLVIEDAFNHAVEHETRFPSIALFRDYCDVMKERIEDEEREKQKKAEKTTFENIQRDKTGQQVMKIVRDLMYGRITRGQYIEKLKAIGVDCGLKGWYESQGYALDEKCRLSRKGMKVI